MKQRSIFSVCLVALVCSVFPAVSSAQFHGKTESGTQINQEAIRQHHQQQVAAMGQTASALSGGDTILPEETRAALQQWNPRLGRMQGQKADIWGRGIYHTDGTFTETKEDNETNTLEQVTKSKNGVMLQKRLITRDQLGRPAEVMIYDGRDQFKYRGVLLYDQFGRFAEEQIFDKQGTLIRRKVQQYTTVGQKLPVRSWDYVENVPDDLKLVITRETEDPSQVGGDEKKRGLFGNNSNSNRPEVAPLEGAVEKRKSGGFRLFSGKKKEKN